LIGLAQIRFGGLQQFGRPMQVPLALSLPAYLDALQNLALQGGF
jgi:hypothetical protein